MKTFDCLKQRIKNDLNVNTTNFRRCYPGIHQRGSGAFTWVADMVGNGGHAFGQIGSCYSATQCIESKGKLKWGRNGEIWPD